MCQLCHLGGGGGVRNIEGDALPLDELWGEERGDFAHKERNENTFTDCQFETDKRTNVEE